ncbi:MAG: hypothetical protein BZ137_08245 [Methanosphaera sp. rholeuAM130]|nr:MAG: hypothetical protein BZ137_08245 [Methanosphaera sp. rholeuAM130]
MEDMIRLYIEKRREYQTKISADLKSIEENVYDICEVGDYFSIKSDEEIITIKAIEEDGTKRIAVKTSSMDDFIAFSNLRLTDHPDLILWIIQNGKIIEKGFNEVLINAVRNGENIINTLKALNVDYK